MWTPSMWMPVLDAALDDHPERRAVRRRRAARVAPRAALDADVQRLQPVEQLRRRDLDVVHGPAQVAEVELRGHGLETATIASSVARLSVRFVFRQPRLGDQPLRLQPDRADAVAGRPPLADPAGHQHVVAEELELVLQPLLQLRQRRCRSGCAGSSSAAGRSTCPRGAARARGRTSGSGRGSAAPASG